MEAAQFDAFYESSFHRLVGQISVMIGDRDEAQECVQEAFVRAWSNRQRLDVTQSPEAWVRTTAYRLAVSRWRRLLLGRRSPDRALQDPPAARQPSPDRVALAAALRQLPEAHRRVLVLHHVCDLSVRDVAIEIGVPEGTVKVRLMRGRAALALLLSDGANGADGRDHARESDSMVGRVSGRSRPASDAARDGSGGVERRDNGLEPNGFGKETSHV